MKKRLVTLGVVAACCCLRAAEADKVVVGEGEDAKTYELSTQI